MAVDFKYSDAYSRANVVAYKAQDGSIYVGVAIYPISFQRFGLSPQFEVFVGTGT